MFGGTFTIGKPMIVPAETGIPYPEVNNVRPLPIYGETSEDFSSIEKMHNSFLELFKLRHFDPALKLSGAGNLEMDSLVTDYMHVPESYEEYCKDIKDLEPHLNPQLKDSRLVEEGIIDSSFFKSACAEFAGAKKIDQMAVKTNASTDKTRKAAVVIGESLERIAEAAEEVKKIGGCGADVHNKSTLVYALSFEKEVSEFEKGMGKYILDNLNSVDEEDQTDQHKKITKSFSSNLAKLKQFYEKEQKELQLEFKKLTEKEMGRLAGVISMKAAGKSRWKRKKAQYEEKVREAKNEERLQKDLEQRRIEDSRRQEQERIARMNKRKVKEK